MGGGGGYDIVITKDRKVYIQHGRKKHENSVAYNSHWYPISKPSGNFNLLNFLVNYTI